MGILKRQIKRIISIVLIITILISLMPNFGLLISNATTEKTRAIIVKPAENDFIFTTEGDRVFKLNIYLNDVVSSGFSLKIKYPSDKLSPAMLLQVNETTQYLIESNDTKNFMKFTNFIDSPYNSSSINDGYLYVNAIEKDSNALNIEGELLICSITFKVKDNLQLFSELSSKDFEVDVNESVIWINGSDSSDENLFSVEGFLDSLLPEISSLSISKNPTEGNQYTHGDTIDLTGGELIATYTDNSSKVISMLDENVTIKTGEKEGAIANINIPKITFEYEGKTADLDINVIDPVENIKFYDKNNILENYEFRDGDPIPLASLFIKTITKSGVENEVSLSDSKITLNSEIADTSKIENPYFDESIGEYSGIQKVEITYKDENVIKTTAFNILVNDKVGEIKISQTNPPQKILTINDEFQKTGAIEVIGEYSGISFGEIDIASDEVTVTQVDGTKVDLNKVETDKELKVTYAGKSITYKVNVQNAVKSIEVNKQIETKYNKELTADDFTGVTVTEIMADGTNGETKPLDIAWIDMSTYDNKILTKQEVIINYPCEDKIVKGKIIAKVKDELLGIKIDNLKTEYTYKEELDYTDAEFYVKYISGEIGPLALEEDVLQNTFDSSVIGEQEVTFTYNDGIETASTTIKINVKRATLEAPKCEKLMILEDQALSSIESKLPTTEYGSVVWENPNQTLKAGEIKQINAIYKMNDTYKPFYNDVALTVEVEAESKEISSIAIKTNPKLEYYEGQTLDVSALVLEATYVDGTKGEIIRGYTIEGVDVNEPLQTENEAVTTKKITIKYKDFSPIELTITIKPDEVTGIILNAENAKTEYKYNEELDLSNVTVKKVMASGIEQTPVPVINNSEVTISNNYDKTKIDIPQIINITYAGFSESITVTVKDYVAKITLSDETREQLEKEYKYGDTILSGDTLLYVDVYMASDMENPIKAKITNDMINADTTKLGSQNAKITYGGAEVSFSIEVKDYILAIEITKEPAKRVYKIGEDLDLTGLALQDVMASGATRALIAEEYNVSALNSSTKGLKEITITRKDSTVLPVKFNVLVIDENEDVEIQINTLPTENSKYGEPINLTGGSIIVKPVGTTEGTIIQLTDSTIEIQGYNPNKLGAQEVKVIYKYEDNKILETILPITVVDYRIDDIKISSLPEKLEYKFGEELSLTGGEVAKLMASGREFAKNPITMDMISGYDPNKVGTQTIKVAYSNGTATFNVTVVDNTYSISMNSYPDKVKYKYGEELDTTGATIKVTKDSGTKIIPVSIDMISGYDKNKSGEQLITVSYDGYKTNFAVTVDKKIDAGDNPGNNPGGNSSNKPDKKPTNNSGTGAVNKVEYLVIFKDYDGTILKREYIKQGDGANPPTVATRSGYKFIGWDKEFEDIQEDIIITAQYEEIKLASITLHKRPKVELGGEIDLSNIVMEIFDEEGNKIKEVPITSDMISGFNSNKLGIQDITVTYIDEEGKVYKSTFKVEVKKPVKTLGKKDETQNDDIKDVIVPSLIGIVITGLLLVLLNLANNKNVKIYAVTEEGRKLLGKEKINKTNKKINLDGYKEVKNTNLIELELDSKIVEKLQEEKLEIILDNKTQKYSVAENIKINK